MQSRRLATANPFDWTPLSHDTSLRKTHLAPPAKTNRSAAPPLHAKPFVAPIESPLSPTHFFSEKSESSRSPFQFLTRLLRATPSLESRQARSTNASTHSPKTVSRRFRLARTNNTAL